jgi:thiamine transport system substrate-binding protein
MSHRTGKGMSNRKFQKFFIILVATIATVQTAFAETKQTLTIYTYDSFISEWGPGPAIKKNFEAECNCELKFIGLDSSIGILGRVQLEGASSPADIVLGLDTNLSDVAAKTGLFRPHRATSAPNNLPVSFQDDIFMPFDWGYFAFIYDKNKIKTPPTSFEDLIASDNNWKIAIQDPRTSTPGLGLLLWIKAIYGEKAPKIWAGLKPKILTVTKGWWDAYSIFLEGDADMVLSYTTSPAYHMIAEGKDNYAAAKFAPGHYAQIEVAAILKSGKSPELAERFINFIQSEKFQSVIPTANWMYPTQKDLTPAEFSSLVKPEKTFLLPSHVVRENKGAWVNEWIEATQ